MKLTPEQLRAASAKGSVAVTAGAGTGKTSLLAARYLHHVREDQLSPLSVVAVTFTEKAAAELRSRIRRTLTAEKVDEALVSELEAAQISTIHALAARICRDFYSVAGIPADFTVLIDNQRPQWVMDAFDKAIGSLDPVLIERLGYSWLYSTLDFLLLDPHSSGRALALGSSVWREAIESAAAEAARTLNDSEELLEVTRTAAECAGAPGDKLEDVRASVHSVIQNGANIQDLYFAIKGFKANLGAKGNWQGDHLSRVRGCFAPLKKLVVESYEIAVLKYGANDEEAAVRVELLKLAFAHVNQHIAAEKLTRKTLDFNDLEQYALKILQDPAVIDHYRKRWRAILVDEFQDTSPIQAEIVERLTGDSTLTIVGDEKQAIYGFRGADVGVFDRVRKQILDEKKGADVTLTRTFRTHSQLVDNMNDLFEPLLADFHQPLEAERATSKLFAPYIQAAFVSGGKDSARSKLYLAEARYIAERVKELNAAGVAFNEMAIISRTWAPLDVYLDVLAGMKLPAVHAGGGSLLDTREAKDAMSLLELVIEPNDDVPLVAVLRSPFFALSDVTLYNTSKTRLRENSWWETIRNDPNYAHPVAVIQMLLEARKESTASEMLQLADRSTGYSSVIANLPFGERRVADWRGVMEMLRRQEQRGEGDIFGATRYLNELIRIKTEVPRPPLEVGDAVSLMTIHNAKGLEWPVVFIPDLARDENYDSNSIFVDQELGVVFKIEGEGFDKVEPAAFTLVKRKKKIESTNESKRLLYVAITRAKDKVFLTATKEKGFAIDLLNSGLEAAGVTNESIELDENAIAPIPAERDPFPQPKFVNVEPILTGAREVTATSLSVYAICPRKFRYQFVDAHPGVNEGIGASMRIGSLTHTALELGIDTAEGLSLAVDESDEEHIRQAVELANRFNDDGAYSDVRDLTYLREHPFAFEHDGMRIAGIVDLVGPDFILDYKTDAEMEPEDHRFQLWVYAKALGKKRALLAYLRHGTLYEFDSESLVATESHAASLLTKMKRGDYEPTPSPKVCGRCQFSLICKASLAAS